MAHAGPEAPPDGGRHGAKSSLSARRAVKKLPTGIDCLHAMPKLNKVEQADGKGWGDRGRRYLKKRKARLERRRANIDPETQPAYTRFKGWNL